MFECNYTCVLRLLICINCLPHTLQTKWFFADNVFYVDPIMPFKVTFSHKFPVTFFALKWPFACVYSRVDRKSTFSKIPFPTHLALKRSFTCVTSHMNFEGTFTFESIMTHVTFEWSRVKRQLLFSSKILRTFLNAFLNDFKVTLPRGNIRRFIWCYIFYFDHDLRLRRVHCI